MVWLNLNDGVVADDSSLLQRTFEPVRRAQFLGRHSVSLL